MKTIIGVLGLSVVLGGCSSVPLGPEPERESASVASRLQEEVALNAEAAEELRLISRLYVGDYRVLEWYQPLPGVIGFAVVQPGGYEPVDYDGLRGLKPTEVFKKFARGLEVPEALARLEAHPEVLQELQAPAAIESFLPEADLKVPGVTPQKAFTTSQGTSLFFSCLFADFRNSFCTGWDGPGGCVGNVSVAMSQRANLVQESQGALYSVVGTNNFRIDIDGCNTASGGNEGLNRCSGAAIPGTGSWFSVSQGFVRSWHGNRQTQWWGDDAYNHLTSGQPGSAGNLFHLGTRSFSD